MSSTFAATFTKFGCAISAASVLAARSSSSVKWTAASTPLRMLFHRASTLRAPGKRPAMPMMATSDPFNSASDMLLTTLDRKHVAAVAALLLFQTAQLAAIDAFVKRVLTVL